MFRQLFEHLIDNCKFYRRDTGTCRTGCEQDNVARDGICPFIGDQPTCKCYKGPGPVEEPGDKNV